METYVRMFLLYELKKTGHIWASKVIDRLKPREYRCLREALEVIFTYVLQKNDRDEDQIKYSGITLF